MREKLVTTIPVVTKYDVADATAAPSKPHLGIRSMSKTTVAINPAPEARRLTSSRLMPAKELASTMLAMKGMQPARRITKGCRRLGEVFAVKETDPPSGERDERHH